MYNLWRCTYTVWTCMCNICKWYKPETDDRNEAALKEQNLSEAETSRCCKADLAWCQVKCGCESVKTCLYDVYTVIYIYVHSWICMYHVNTRTIYIHERVRAMYIHINEFMNMWWWSCADVYVLCTFKYVNAWTCMYMAYIYIYIYIIWIWMCMYHVNTSICIQ